MKRIFIFTVLVLIIVTTNPAFAYAADKAVEAPYIRIIVDEKVLACEDVPIVINGRTLLPLRAVAVSLGVRNDDQHIIWDGKERSATIIKDDKKIKVIEGSLTAYINDESVTLDVGPFMYSKNGRTYIPVRFVSQALNKAVVWDQSTKSVYIHKMLSQREIWEEMHKMANTKVVTQDETVFSSKKIETSHVDELIAIAERSDYDDKAKIIEILQRWKKGDFRQGVDDHNYFWGKERSYTSRMLSQTEMWEEIHKMANTKIISQDNMYYGRTKVETTQVNELIAIAEKSDYDDKTTLLDILYRWRNGDFRQCVDDHNYVWSRLGGEVGRATSLMEDVKIAMANYEAPMYTGDRLGRDVGKAISLTEETLQAMASYTEPKQ